MTPTFDLLASRPNLEVADVTRSVDFYRRALGLEPVTTMGEPPIFAMLASGDAMLVVAHADRPAVAGIAACYLDVTDADAAHHRCVEAGAEITVALTDQPWGMRDFVLRDPDSHQIAVGQRLTET